MGELSCNKVLTSFSLVPNDTLEGNGGAGLARSQTLRFRNGPHAGPNAYVGHVLQHKIHQMVSRDIARVCVHVGAILGPIISHIVRCHFASYCEILSWYSLLINTAYSRLAHLFVYYCNVNFNILERCTRVAQFSFKNIGNRRS